MLRRGQAETAPRVPGSPVVRPLHRAERRRTSRWWSAVRDRRPPRWQTRGAKSPAGRAEHYYAAEPLEPLRACAPRHRRARCLPAAVRLRLRQSRRFHLRRAKPACRSGTDAEGHRVVVRAIVQGYWAPLTWLSYMADAQFWVSAPGPSMPPTSCSTPRPRACCSWSCGE